MAQSTTRGQQFTIPTLPVSIQLISTKNWCITWILLLELRLLFVDQPGMSWGVSMRDSIQLITKMPTITIAHAAKELKLHVQPQQLSNIFSAAMNEKKPTKHTSSGYISRYRFICKHFDDKEISEFIESEIESLNTIGYLDHVIGRIIAARYTFTQPACDSRTPPIGLG